MRPISIALAGLPRLLRDTLAQTILAEHDLDLVGEVDNLDQMPELVTGTHADVVLVGCDQRDAEQASARLATEAPHARMLAITESGRETVLFELCPRRVELGNLSPDELLAVIRRGACHDPSNGGAPNP